MGFEHDVIDQRNENCTSYKGSHGRKIGISSLQQMNIAAKLGIEPSKNTQWDYIL
jgi:hypothetical protein